MRAFENVALWEEVKEAVKNHIEENEFSIVDGELFNTDETEVNIYDMVNTLYNEDYYIIGTYQAREWLKEGDNLDTMFDALDYYQDNFGCAYDDITDVEKVVSLTVLMFAESNINDIIEELAEEDNE